MVQPLVVPGAVAQQLDAERRADAAARDPSCPEARPAALADGRRAILCQVSKDSYVARENPRPIFAFCCGDHTQCPVWQLSRDGGKGIEAFHRDRERFRQEALTRDQIRRGVRLDDKGVELDDRLDAQGRGEK